ncbi:hypothetical protein EVAR_90629_1 [Eumeta japonica]|uniref:Integrase zinc-binding domain-containing protein n=1 Tax=Eumeta variegata TaxID=151549 RepID=A0A4C1ZSN1_EUMVA|nr:hypothetical protein EVAR_90629_1 [Eumeta japonica]
MRAAAVGAPLPRSSLRALDVMLTDDWLRVGGRLRRSPTLSFDEKHPIILDGRDHAVRLLVEHYHRRAGHANHEAVVNIIRERFWITRLRPTVKKVANACRLCRVRRAQPVTPKMADLPEGASPSSKAIYAHRGGLLRATGGDRRATSREEVGGVIHVSDDALSIWRLRPRYPPTP